MPEEQTILVVENENHNRMLVEKILSLGGYKCVSAENGQEALDIIENQPVSLILTDLSMPVMDGYRATQIIRQRPGYENIPIIAVTAHAMNGDREYALRIGCDEYIAKPFKPKELLAIVEFWLNKTRQPSQ